jgi:hypothetical protein
MTNYNPKTKSHDQWSTAEKEYNLAVAKSDAERAYARLTGSDSYKALVASEISKLALAKLPRQGNPEDNARQQFERYASESQ